MEVLPMALSDPQLPKTRRPPQLLRLHWSPRGFPSQPLSKLSPTPFQLPLAYPVNPLLSHPRADVELCEKLNTRRPGILVSRPYSYIQNPLCTFPNEPF